MEKLTPWAAELRRAALQGNLKKIESILKDPARSANVRTARYLTPLNGALENGNIESAKLLIERGATINADTNSIVIMSAIKSSIGPHAHSYEPISLIEEIVRCARQKSPDKESFANTISYALKSSAPKECILFLVKTAAQMNWMHLPTEDFLYDAITSKKTRHWSDRTPN